MRFAVKLAFYNQRDNLIILPHHVFHRLETRPFAPELAHDDASAIFDFL